MTRVHEFLDFQTRVSLLFQPDTFFVFSLSLSLSFYVYLGA